MQTAAQIAAGEFNAKEHTKCTLMYQEFFLQVCSSLSVPLCLSLCPFLSNFRSLSLSCARARVHTQKKQATHQNESLQTAEPIPSLLFERVQYLNEHNEKISELQTQVWLLRDRSAKFLAPKTTAEHDADVIRCRCHRSKVLRQQVLHL